MSKNSLKEESSNFDSKIVEIRLSITHPNNKEKVFVLLEGQTDIKLFRKIFSKQYVDTTALDGKDKVVRALIILKEEGNDSVIGIKDADFDHILGVPTIDNLFVTDLHDMEIQMMESSAFDAIISEYTKEDIDSKQLKEEVYSNALTIGYARWFNADAKLKTGESDLSFDGLKYQNFFSSKGKKLVFDENTFLSELFEESKKRKPSMLLTEEKLKVEIMTLKNQSENILQICSGHDVSRLLAFLFIKTFNGNEIEKGLRLAYSLDNFKETDLYANLIEWCSRTDSRLFA